MTIHINGTAHQVLNSYSSGPNCTPHTYDIAGGYVYEIAGAWTLQRPGQFAVAVQVAR